MIDWEKIINIENLNMVVNIIKMISIALITYYTNYKILNIKNANNIYSIRIIILIIISSIIYGILKDISTSMIGVSWMILIMSIIFSINTKNKLIYSAMINIISFSINYSIFFIAIVISFIPFILLKIENDYLNLIIIIFTYWTLIYYFLKFKRFKKGFIFLQKKLKNEYVQILMLGISMIVILSFIILTSFNIILNRKLFVGFIIFILLMFITIQKSIQLYYKQKLLIQDLEETKKELEEKKEEIKKLEQENLSFSKKSHSIAHKQKALEHKLNEILLLKTELGSETNIKEKIDKISEEISKNKPQVELSKTNIEEIDDMLKYMQSESIKNNIDFDLQIIGNIHQMTNNYISKEKLEILLADHIKNAIIAINYSDNINKSILVRLGKIDGFYSLYIYDSGIEFEINTLLNLGVKPSTTHKSSGGTGMGFMNTFDTVREYKASFILEEYGKPSKDDYTKAIMIKFDKKEDFKIISYRKEEIENKAKGKKLNFILNKRNNI